MGWAGTLTPASRLEGREMRALKKEVLGVGTGALGGDTGVKAEVGTGGLGYLGGGTEVKVEVGTGELGYLGGGGYWSCRY